ncbi:hypothetical protein [Falsiroseomonas tokyonensis]|uniref:Uncharacterized protein n=1 Tax=Falsiroseomonas tokyonensis TaxID=430521 RepID=A0ABV7BV17_9PROT|nr:hypothetical protein [Falsiroseomonas tokyonensis]MBU8539469.1 hypothetical protein [Falsiroseomonas tokyonensis]
MDDKIRRSRPGNPFPNRGSNRWTYAGTGVFATTQQQQEATTHFDNAPALRVYGPHARRIATLIAINPGLAQRLLCAPTRVIHAVGAFLHLADSGTDPDVAATLHDTDPRALLRLAIPGCPPTLFRALDRAGSIVGSRVFYQRIASISAGPYGNLIVDGSGRIDDRLLRHIETLAEAADPAVASLPPSLLSDPSIAEAVGAVASLLRASGLDPDAAMRGIPANAGIEAVFRRLKKQVSALRAPSVQPMVVSPLRQILSIGELRALGRRLDLCVSSPQHGGVHHWMRLIGGESLYLTHEAHPVLIELRRSGRGVWHLEDARAAHNRPVFPPARREIIELLRLGGQNVVPVDPAEGLVTLSCRSDTMFEQWERSLGAELAALDDG